MEATLSNLKESPPQVVQPTSRPYPDFVMGEVVTTSSGHKIRGVFGEVSEKTMTSNGWQIHGVFYE